jgi:hypothetical protein
VTADLVQEELERVRRRRGQLERVVRGLLVLAAAVVAQLHAARVELLVDVLEHRIVEVERLDELVHLCELEASLLGSAVDQRCKRAFEGFAAGEGHTVIVLTGSSAP